MLPQPPTAFELSGSGLNVFDCRWDSPRRMGIGDRIVVGAAIQQIASAGYKVAVLCNPRDRELFDLMNISVLPEADSLIPWTDHVMAAPIGTTNNEMDAIDLLCRHPVERALWGIGLHHLSKPMPDYRWNIPPRRKRRGVLAWCPVEISRRHSPITSDEWREQLERLTTEYSIQQVELWCGTREQPGAFELISLLPANLARNITIRSAFTLREWLEQFMGAACILTANTAGLWVALGLPVPLVVAQREATIPHMALWQARPGWNSGLCRVVKLGHKKSPGSLWSRELYKSPYPAVTRPDSPAPN